MADRLLQKSRAATPSPSTGAGTTVAAVQPFVFAPSIAPRLGIDMPGVGSGSYSEMTISTALPASPKAKGVNADDTAGALTPVTAGPRRIAARMTVTHEDVAADRAAEFRIGAQAERVDEPVERLRRSVHQWQRHIPECRTG